ncbi:hypothetical protein [Frateuria sp. STR12]|uniref:hypothetical protein n=1 Tax=Frateuria hangzhouensis TaxID=2995589 RepID=UPI00226082C2|nr:hypothetical protein [Frateuria sp. STR12]MCX7514254.1 hypothetical protein [Frateuria sp. STR12]
MTASLRPFARSRGLFAVGLLAWLMLVVTSLAAAPLGMGSAYAHSVHEATAAVGEPLHHGLSHVPSHDCCEQHDGCCGHATAHVCGCVGMCASALAPMPASLLTASAVSAGYGHPTRIHAPTLPAAPPLRPPSV